MKYHITTHSTTDCVTKLWSIHTFSSFLAQFAPDCCLQDICRPLIVAYMGSSWYQKGSTDRQILLLGSLRVFLETSAHYLNCEGMCKEQIIFNEDFPRPIEKVSREIPEEVLFQLRLHLPSLPTAILRMVMILLAVGMRISELCLLSTDCLICDDRHEWYLRFYQSKGHQEHVVPLVEEEVIGAIQAQQQEVRDRWGTTCPYLFPSSHSPLKPYKQMTFRRKLNQWAIEHEIKDRNGKLYHFTAHPFRHTVGMRLLNEDVPLEVISRLLGHRSLSMTQVYARIRDSKMRMELERAAQNHKTVDYQGNVVKGDAQANTPEVQMTRKGVRGQTLPVGGCGRMIVLGDCSHANKCLTCPMWLTSTDDVPALKSFHERAMRLKQRAIERGNQFVVQQQDHIIPILEVRIKSLEIPEMDGSLCLDDVLAQLCSDLTEAESGLEEARVAGLVLASRHLERAITEIKARIVALEGSA
ncbi:tyrosine-type recombinase/integrase [Dictyobacter halimunensis]